MPIYEYRCDNGHAFEVMQRMTDDPVADCEVCAAPVQRVFHPVAVHFKGSGFYNTDYGKKTKAASSNSDSDSAPSSSEKSDKPDKAASSTSSSDSSSSAKSSSRSSSD